MLSSGYDPSTDLSPKNSLRHMRREQYGLAGLRLSMSLWGLPQDLSKARLPTYLCRNNSLIPQKPNRDGCPNCSSEASCFFIPIARQDREVRQPLRIKLSLRHWEQCCSPSGPVKRFCTFFMCVEHCCILFGFAFELCRGTDPPLALLWCLCCFIFSPQEQALFSYFLIFLDC